MSCSPYFMPQIAYLNVIIQCEKFEYLTHQQVQGYITYYY